MSKENKLVPMFQRFLELALPLIHKYTFSVAKFVVYDPVYPNHWKTNTQLN